MHGAGRDDNSLLILSRSCLYCIVRWKPSSERERRRSPRGGILYLWQPHDFRPASMGTPWPWYSTVVLRLFLAIEARGGTWFRSPYPNCRAEPFKVLLVRRIWPRTQWKAKMRRNDAHGRRRDEGSRLRKGKHGRHGDTQGASGGDMLSQGSRRGDNSSCLPACCPTTMHYDVHGPGGIGRGAL